MVWPSLLAAFEPHSALPLAMPGVFCEYSGLLPPALSGIKTLASSSVRDAAIHLLHASSTCSFPAVVLMGNPLPASPLRLGTLRAFKRLRLHTNNCVQIFFVPGLRHAWHWLGLRPVSRKVMASILSSGGSVALCPGGVKVGTACAVRWSASCHMNGCRFELGCGRVGFGSSLLVRSHQGPKLQWSAWVCPSSWSTASCK